MNLGELEGALNLSVQDKSLSQYYRAYLNNAILELAATFELPALKLLNPYPLPLTTDNWLFDLPADFQKNLFRCADSNYSNISRRFRTIQALDRLDLDHDEIADHVTAVAVSEAETDDHKAGNKIGVFPKANETIYLWYYRKPTPLVKPGDVPFCIPEAYHFRVIIPKAKLVAYELLQDQVENFDTKGLQYWQAKLAAGLRGSPADGPGLIHYLNKIQGGPRRTGGRDPVGARYA